MGQQYRSTRRVIRDAKRLPAGGPRTKRVRRQERDFFLRAWQDT